MNAKILNIPQLNHRYEEIIAHYYPNVDFQNVVDIKVDSWVLIFKYNNSTYTCLADLPHKLDTKNLNAAFLWAQEAVMRVLLNPIESINSQDVEDNVNMELFERSYMILSEYYPYLPREDIKNLRVLWKYMIFLYKWFYYACPSAHKTSFPVWKTFENEIFNLSFIIKQYNSNIVANLVSDINIIDWILYFKYLWVNQLCPLLTVEATKIRCEEAMVHEKDLHWSHLTRVK